MDPPPEPLEPPPEEEEGEPQILYRIRTGDHPEWEEENARQVPRDVSFEVPGDARTGTGVGAEATAIDEERFGEPSEFAIGAGVSWARLLTSVDIDFVRVEERFDWRIPDFGQMRLGLSASQSFAANQYLVGGGLRAGLGAYFCETRLVRCEIVAVVQPGVLAGDVLGARFDLHGSLEAHFDFDGVFGAWVEGGFSILGTESMFQVGGVAAILF
ncbi:MAG: hypothetical protein SangKO_092120 [Sandaracinaceae bacterium]